MPRVVFVVGPTASGKTALAVALAERFGGEIVNADSRQFYRGMEIGTAKPTPAERARAVHHLIDVLDPDAACSLAWFMDTAHAAIAEIHGRGQIPIVAGGTGQYVRALLEGWHVPRVPPNETLRRTLNERVEQDGLASVYAELAERDPGAAARVDRHNPRRVIRALEVALAGRADDELAPRLEPLGQELVLGIRIERDVLYRRIDERVDAMFAAGLVAEVQALRAAGFSCDLPSFSAIGYCEVCGFLRGDSTLEEARYRTKTATHRLARVQATWFRRSDPRITWLDAGPGLEEQAADTLRRFLAAEPARE